MSDNIYLKLAKDSTRVVLIHYNPFDPNTGLMISDDNGDIEVAKARLEKEGAFVESIPAPPANYGNYRYVLHYSSAAGCTYTQEVVPSGDSVLLNTLEKSISAIKSIIPNSKLITTTDTTVDKSAFDISDLFGVNSNYGVSVNKNGSYLKNGIDFSVVKSGSTVTLNIFKGIQPSDYAIVIVCDNLSEHQHNISGINNLQNILNTKANVSHIHAIADISGLSETLLSFANKTHTHTIDDITGDFIATSSKAGLVKLVDSTDGTATDSAVTQLSINTALQNKADKNHTHNYLSSINPVIYDTLSFKSSTSTDPGVGGNFYLGTDKPSSSTRLNYDGYLYATKMFNAVYNDVAECFIPIEGLTYNELKYKIVEITDNGKIKLATTQSNRVVGITSTNFGQLLGGTNEEILSNDKIPVGLCGTLYVDAEYKVNIDDIGKFICSSDFGKAIAINKDEIAQNYGYIVGKIICVDTENNRYKVLLTIK